MAVGKFFSAFYRSGGENPAGPTGSGSSSIMTAFVDNHHLQQIMSTHLDSMMTMSEYNIYT